MFRKKHIGLKMYQKYYGKKVRKHYVEKMLQKNVMEKQESHIWSKNVLKKSPNILYQKIP